MQVHQIKRENKNKIKRQFGRGGKRGKTSGRGGKGQTARAGNRRRPAMRDMIKKLPKLRGRGVNINKAFRPKPVAVNLSDLNIFENNTTINPMTLLAAGIIKMKNGKLPRVKILGTGNIDKKFNFEGVEFSSTAKEKLGIRE